MRSFGLILLTLLCASCATERGIRPPKDFVWHTVAAQEDLRMIALRYYGNPKTGFVYLQEVNWDRLARGQSVPGEPAPGTRIKVPSAAEFQQWLREGAKSRISSRNQTVEPSADALLFPDNLSGAAHRTYADYVAAVNAGKETASGPRYDIPARYWAAPLKVLKPIRIYTHRANVVVVQRVRSGVEEGKYIYIPISSYLPQTGDDGFDFSPNPRTKDGQYVLGDGVFDFKGRLQKQATTTPRQVDVPNAGGGMETHYFRADALASIQHLTTEAFWDPGITVAGLSRVMTNIYPTMLAYAQERPLSPALAGRPKTFRFAWSGTSMNPSCFVARFELGETATRLTAAQFRFDPKRAPPYNGLARGERVLTDDERQRLHRALDEFLVTRPLAYPGTGATDIDPELFEYRDGEHYVVAAGNGVCSTNVLGTLHQLCLEAARATKLHQIGSANAGLGPGHTNATDAQVIVEIVGGFGHLTSMELKSDGSFIWHGWEPGRRIASVRKGRLRADELGAIVDLAARIRDNLAEDMFAGGEHSCSLVLRTSDAQAREIKINQAEADHRPPVLKRLLHLLWATRNREEQK